MLVELREVASDGPLGEPVIPLLLGYRAPDAAELLRVPEGVVA